MPNEESNEEAILPVQGMEQWTPMHKAAAANNAYLFGLHEQTLVGGVEFANLSAA